MSIEGLFHFFKKKWQSLATKLVIIKATTSFNKINITTYFENLTIELHVFYTVNSLVKFCVNQILFTIWSISSYFMDNFKLQKLEFKQFIDNIVIDL